MQSVNSIILLFRLDARTKSMII